MQALDLTNTKLESIEPEVFEVQKNTLKKLLLGNTRLRRISASVLAKMNKLEQLDLSNNKWICDIEAKTGTIQMVSHLKLTN